MFVLDFIDMFFVVSCRYHCLWFSDFDSVFVILDLKRRRGKKSLLFPLLSLSMMNWKKMNSNSIMNNVQIFLFILNSSLKFCFFCYYSWVIHSFIHLISIFFLPNQKTGKKTRIETFKIHCNHSIILVKTCWKFFFMFCSNLIGQKNNEKKKKKKDRKRKF